jgi:hypothetical protein
VISVCSPTFFLIRHAHASASAWSLFCYYQRNVVLYDAAGVSRFPRPMENAGLLPGACTHAAPRHSERAEAQLQHNM